MLAIPDRIAHRTKLADWLELNALASPDGRIGFGTLISAADLSTEEQAQDISEEDVWQDDLVLSAQDEINNRLKVVGQDYPFRVDPKGNYIEVVPEITDAGAIYLFCLFLSHATDRSIIPEHLAPAVDNVVRDMFQVCATFAAAGYVSGTAMSFGWPRPEGEAFLAALKVIYAKFGDGQPVDVPRPAAPANVKDEGIDVIAWRPSPDGLPGTHYLLGQVASGHNWTDKSIVSDSEMFHSYWFERQPATRHQDAMFMPFCIEARGHDDTASPQEVLVDHMQRLTKKYGIIVYRYRLARHAAEGLRIHERTEHEVQRADELYKIIQWVREYSEILKAAA